jgi:antibiotic biosynthesis monooxygenase (ABM) superfamily enzyme
VRPPPPAASDSSVTVVTAFHVRPGCEAELETFFDDIGRVVSRYPGFLGRRIIRPKSAADVLGAPGYREFPETRTQLETDAEHDLPEYVSVFRFDSYPHLRAWLGSAERRDLLKTARPLLLEEERKETVLTGLERWFTLPWKPDLPPPTRIKMVMLTVLAAYPLGYVIIVLLGPWLALLPMPLRALVMTVLTVGLLTWVVMPRMTRLFRFWLYPSTASGKLARRGRPPMFAAR